MTFSVTSLEGWGRARADGDSQHAGGWVQAPAPRHTLPSSPRRRARPFAAQTRVHPEDSHSFRVMEAPGLRRRAPVLLTLHCRPSHTAVPSPCERRPALRTPAPPGLAALQLTNAGLSCISAQSLHAHAPASFCKCSREGPDGGRAAAGELQALWKPRWQRTLREAMVLPLIILVMLVPLGPLHRCGQLPCSRHP